MRYIRTKDGKIFEYAGRERTPYGDLISADGTHYRYDCILKEADRVDNLVDGVVVWNDESKEDITFSSNRLMMCAFLPWEIKKTAKGYIRTKWGLKFVAEVQEGKEDLVLINESQLKERL